MVQHSACEDGALRSEEVAADEALIVYLELSLSGSIDLTLIPGVQVAHEATPDSDSLL